VLGRNPFRVDEDELSGFDGERLMSLKVAPRDVAGVNADGEVGSKSGDASQ
jgi:hypothetical protein